MHSELTAVTLPLTRGLIDAVILAVNASAAALELATSPEENSTPLTYTFTSSTPAPIPVIVMLSNCVVELNAFEYLLVIQKK